MIYLVDYLPSLVLPLELTSLTTICGRIFRFDKPLSTNNDDKLKRINKNRTLNVLIILTNRARYHEMQ